jgi:hypothetical protein
MGTVEQIILAIIALLNRFRDRQAERLEERNEEANGALEKAQQTGGDTSDIDATFNRLRKR